MDLVVSPAVILRPHSQSQSSSLMTCDRPSCARVVSSLPPHGPTHFGVAGSSQAFSGEDTTRASLVSLLAECHRVWTALGLSETHVVDTSLETTETLMFVTARCSCMVVSGRPLCHAGSSAQPE